MAKVTGPLNSSEARGSVGSLTYNTWRGISTVKSRSGPGTTQSELQQFVRGLTKRAAVRWSEITPLQRDLWQHYAAEHPLIDWTGNPRRISGFDWYVKCNWRTLLQTDTFVDVPPSATPVLPIDNFAVDPLPGSLLITWSVQLYAPPPTAYVEIWLAGPFSPGRNPNIQDAHIWLIWPYTTGGVSVGSPGSGTWHLFYRQAWSNGLTQPFQRYRITEP